MINMCVCWKAACTPICVIHVLHVMKASTHFFFCLISLPTAQSSSYLARCIYFVHYRLNLPSSSIEIPVQLVIVLLTACLFFIGLLALFIAVSIIHLILLLLGSTNVCVFKLKSLRKCLLLALVCFCIDVTAP